MKRSLMTKEQVEDLLNYIGVDKIQEWKGNKIQFCCPIHGESHPSCGINIDYTPKDTNSVYAHSQVFHCFSCGASGSLSWFLFKSMPDKFKSFKQAEEFIASRYNIEAVHFYNNENTEIHRYEDRFIVVKDDRFIMPKTKLAVFKSGKETYQYFFDRGFDKNDMKEYMIGRDTEARTVTIPAFYEDGVLAGIIGRYIDPNRPKNMRFKVYSFPKNGLVFPADKLQVVNDTIIGVESMFDAILLRKWGYPNTVALMGMEISDEQADFIASRCSKFISLFDDDEGGIKAREKTRIKMKKRGVMFLTCEYPNWGKDPGDWGEIETNRILNTARLTSGIPRI